MTTDQQPYIEDVDQGEGWTLMLGDSCERLAGIDDNSVDFSVYSPPFASLFTYSPSDRDLGNSRNHGEFHEHYGYIVRELMRVIKPGRLVAVHCQQIATQKWKDGNIGLSDFRGELIRSHIDNGWIFHGEVTIDKDPQAQAIRTKATALMFVTLNKDSSMSRPALADYLLLFRKPGENEIAIKPDCDNDTWIEWARPVWYDIRESDTLNTGEAREADDERHICPLQLGLIERAVKLWSNHGDLVLSPFAGIGSEGYESIKAGRRFIGCELKPSYWATACKNLRRAVEIAKTPTLFDNEPEGAGVN